MGFLESAKGESSIYTIGFDKLNRLFEAAEFVGAPPPPPSPFAEVERWCRGENRALLIGPESPKSLLDIRQLDPGAFYHGQDGKELWYGDDAQRFAYEEHAVPGWFPIRKKLIDGSTSKRWEDQSAIVSRDERIPTAAEWVWCLLLYKKVTGHWLLPGHHTRTRSIDSYGRRVYVSVVQGKIYIGHQAEEPHKYIGIVSFLRL